MARCVSVLTCPKDSFTRGGGAKILVKDMGWTTDTTLGLGEHDAPTVDVIQECCVDVYDTSGLTLSVLTTGPA